MLGGENFFQRVDFALAMLALLSGVIALLRVRTMQIVLDGRLLGPR